MEISIIIPALNEADNITTAVEHAWQAGAGEVIVVDGGSTDETRELAESAGGSILESPPGRARQQNAGAARATGDVFLFLHADTWLAAPALEQIRAALADHQVLHGAFQQRIAAEGLGYRLLERGNAWRAGRRGLPYGDQGIFLRRDVFFELGRFPDVPIMEDLLLMRRLRKRSSPVLLPGPLQVDPRRWQKYGIVRQTLRNWSLVAGYQVGVPLERLARRYARHDA